LSKYAVRGFAIAFVATAGLCVPFASLAGAASTTTLDPNQSFYLDLGGSGSVGVQPTAAVPHGEPTASGYANYLVTIEAASGHNFQLTQLGCPGESTAMALHGGDRCYASASSQLAAATSFLTQNSGQNGLVTVDLGFNNVVQCLRQTSGVTSCVSQGLAQIRQQLPVFLSSLQAVAGPGVRFVGVGHYDPFLADALKGSAGLAMANSSLWAISALNRTLLDVYQAAGIPMANVASAFSMHTKTPTTLAGIGSVPANVADTCLMTWMCQPAPYGPNLHPNNAGYLAIANAIATKVSATS
jgi:hypothetical protein